MAQPVSSAYVLREAMRGASDDYLKRPLWEFVPEARRAVLAERAKRWGAPDADQDFDPEYH